MMRAGIREVQSRSRRVFSWRVLALGVDLLEAGKSHLNCSSIHSSQKTRMDISSHQPLSIACACAELRRANRAVTHLYDLVFAPVGIKATQFMALKSISEAGEIAQCNYAREYGISIDTLSRRLGTLRRKGLIEMRRGERHSERLYRVTDRGRELLIQAMPYWEGAQYRLRAKLGEKHWQALFQICEGASRAAKEAEQFRARNGLTIQVTASGD